MNRLRKYMNTTLLGGLGVILPVVIILYIFYLLYIFLRGIIRPISSLISIESSLSLLISDIITIILIVALCLIIGIVVRTRVGNFFHKVIELRLLKRIPGYSVTKEVVLNLTGEGEIKFSRVALCKPYDNDTLCTGFIMDRHNDQGYLTVFCPTGPNPTTGLIYHLRKERVFPLDIGVDQGVKSILGCGVGTKPLMKDYGSRYLSTTTVERNIS